MKTYRHTRPIFPFSFARHWQAHRGHDAIGPERMFARDAINDLPDDAKVQFEANGYSCLEPYRVALCRDHKGFGKKWERWA